MTLGGSVFHIEIKRPDSAGSLRVFTRYDTPSMQETTGSGGSRASLRAAVPSPSASPKPDYDDNCHPDQRRFLDEQFGYAVDIGLDCLQKLQSHKVVATLARMLTRPWVFISCDPIPYSNPDTLAYTDAAHNERRHWIHVVPHYWEKLGEGSFPYDPGPSASSVLFHELLHVRPEWNHNDDEKRFSNRREVDPIYSCEALCFDQEPSRCSCASCLGTNICDSRCSDAAIGHLKDCNPGLSFQCPCPGPNWFRQFNKCAGCLAVCPSGLH
jgi:hypothetical protein